jgi:tetraprenyl-beta-curcumene synthase
VFRPRSHSKSRPGERSAFAGRSLLVARAYGALALTNARYWSGVWPRVNAQLTDYERRAQAIRDPTLRGLALGKLSEQRLHGEVAATFATLAPASLRVDAARAMVALEVMYDYLDALTEQPVGEALENGMRLFECFQDALAPGREPAGDYYALHPHAEDGYLSSLVGEARESLGRLPALASVAPVARRCAVRFAQAQVRAHAAVALGDGQLQEWAGREGAEVELDWLEYFAGGTSSVIGLHALVAAAATAGTSAEEASRIDETYLRMGAIVTMLDSLVDRELDVANGVGEGFSRYCPDRDQLAGMLSRAARETVAHALETQEPAHHAMTLAGVSAFYTSAPGARGRGAREVATRLHRELRPLIYATLVVTRAARWAKRERRGAAQARIHGSPVGPARELEPAVAGAEAIA